ncbi:hypothetical protein [Pseudomonas marginalis]|uniref:hypothetical protein n=1 Tax=Pseudomonas marginalis TaxID=298 RepID=UPI00248101A4|nr:hypothetical protein [Pseudomonas marginalis]WGT27026.1 hypothetical protein QGQ83_25685 [Pseudomonas marginalis]
MRRALSVDIDESTWPGAGLEPCFPSQFLNGVSQYDLNIPSMLLLIGYLTTPAATTGVTLSEFWAWVRYLAAISSNDIDMRLSQSFADLDAHQKTILSDDFGMGVSMHWLLDTLSFDRIVDGRYFMQQFASSLSVTQQRTAKRGPNKTPDFVARDTNGLWHVVECKGTQSGVVYSEEQMSGGINQKLSLKFPTGHTGQRLVCGLSIGVEGGLGSRLKIIDPVADEPIEILSSELPRANDAATRGVMSKALRMAGFEVSADTIASPRGKWPAWMRTKSVLGEQQRRNFLIDRDTKARDELTYEDLHTKLFDDVFIGREVRIELPRAIVVDGSYVSHVIIRQGINRDAIRELAEQPTVNENIQEVGSEWLDMVGKNQTSSDGLFAALEIGKVFRAEIILGG